uniref:Uncharacterized protein n=1 Tax=Hyaloperonospora arabidopsidis (strain Emoy2) TaxID=559515 RepID=M4B6P6_HYAAE
MWGVPPVDGGPEYICWRERLPDDDGGPDMKLCWGGCWPGKLGCGRWAYPGCCGGAGVAWIGWLLLLVWIVSGLLRLRRLTRSTRILWLLDNRSETTRMTGESRRWHRRVLLRWVSRAMDTTKSTWSGHWSRSGRRSSSSTKLVSSCPVGRTSNGNGGGWYPCTGYAL